MIESMESVEGFLKILYNTVIPAIILYYLVKVSNKVDVIALSMAKEYKTKEECEKDRKCLNSSFQEKHDLFRRDFETCIRDNHTTTISIMNDIVDIKTKCAKHDGFELAKKQ